LAGKISYCIVEGEKRKDELTAYSMVKKRKRGRRAG
jgi:hypothetical protein